MAIRVEHGPSAALVGRMSYGAGEAMGKEEAQRYLLDQWQKYYGVKKPLETQERIADKNLAYQREHLGVQKDWFDQNYILDERRVGYEGDRVGIDRDRLSIDQQQVDQQMQIAQLNAAMQGSLAQYNAESQANLVAMQQRRPIHYSGRVTSPNNPTAGFTGGGYGGGPTPAFDYQSLLGQYGTQGLGSAALAPKNTTSSYRRA